MRSLYTTQETPLGLPVIQPYRRETGLQIKTLMQNVILVDCNDKLPVSSSRQRSAFPPNFVHSLDSTHMLMTANKLKVCMMSVARWTGYVAKRNTNLLNSPPSWHRLWASPSLQSMTVTGVMPPTWTS